MDTHDLPELEMIATQDHPVVLGVNTCDLKTYMLMHGVECNVSEYRKHYIIASLAQDSVAINVLMIALPDFLSYGPIPKAV